MSMDVPVSNPQQHGVYFPPQSKAHLIINREIKNTVAEKIASETKSNKEYAFTKFTTLSMISSGISWK
jgi:hypothetical protein